MPLYQYECRKEEVCGHITEEFRTIADRDVPQECELCHGPTARITVPRSFGVWWSETCSDGTKVRTTMGPTVGIHPAGKEQQRRNRAKGYSYDGQHREYRSLKHESQWDGQDADFQSPVELLLGGQGETNPTEGLTRVKKVDDDK